MFLPLPHVLKKQSSQSYKQDSKQQCRGVQHKEVPSQMGLYKPFAAMSTFVMRPLSNLGSKSLTWSNSEGNSKISINVSNIDETHVFFSVLTQLHFQCKLSCNKLQQDTPLKPCTALAIRSPYKHCCHDINQRHFAYVDTIINTLKHSFLLLFN